MPEKDGVVLLVDDDPQILELFTRFLEDVYEIRTAESGDEALSVMSDEVDVVLLDRRMPKMPGHETLTMLRKAGFDQPVAMITAVDPDFDVLEMDFDEYVVKPVTQGELRGVVETMLLREQFESVVREYFSLVAKISTLEQQKTIGELSENEEYVRLKDRLNTIKHDARRALDMAIESGKFDEIYGDLFHDENDPGI